MKGASRLLKAGDPATSASGRARRLPKKLRREGALALGAVAALAAGASTSYSCFPQRFAWDLGMPLPGALTAISVVATLVLRGAAASLTLSPSVPLMATAVGLAVWVDLSEATNESTELTFTNGPTATPEILAAGDWLRAHNEGGNIVVSPREDQVPSRMMLAMGGYSAMQSYTEINLRYLLLFKDLPGRGVVPYWTLFDDPAPRHRLRELRGAHRRAQVLGGTDL